MIMRRDREDGLIVGSNSCPTEFGNRQSTIHGGVTKMYLWKTGANQNGNDGM